MIATEMSELICTRISHDLSGGIGSVSNALELIEDDPMDIEDATAILKAGSQTLMARLKFFRQAFGLKNTAPGDIKQMQKLADDYVKTYSQTQTPVQICWHIQNVSLYKIVFLGIMILTDVFIKGGTIDVSENDEGLVLKAVSNFDLSQNKIENIKKTLESHIPEENPALIAPVVYLQKLVDEVGIKVFVEHKDKEAVLYLK